MVISVMSSVYGMSNIWCKQILSKGSTLSFKAHVRAHASEPYRYCKPVTVIKVAVCKLFAADIKFHGFHCLSVTFNDVFLRFYL